jgi:hypothetical protein
LHGTEDNSKWKVIFLSGVEKYMGNYIWLSYQEDTKCFKDINPFWEDVLKSWNLLTKAEQVTDPR